MRFSKMQEYKSLLNLVIIVPYVAYFIPNSPVDELDNSQNAGEGEEKRCFIYKL